MQRRKKAGTRARELASEKIVRGHGETGEGGGEEKGKMKDVFAAAGKRLLAGWKVCKY